MPFDVATRTAMRSSFVSSLLFVLIAAILVIQLTLASWTMHPFDGSISGSTTIHQVSFVDSLSSTEPGQSNHTQGKQKRWAYAFLVANCNPAEEFPAYRGFLFNVLAATYILKFDEDNEIVRDGREYHGNNSELKETLPVSRYSRAEVVLMIQMAPESPVDRLPQSEEALLRRMQIQVRYLPQRQPSSIARATTDDGSSTQRNRTFYDLVLAKFQTFQWTEYSRILFLDSDVLPLCNLDYLLELSEDGSLLRKNVLHAMYEDPVNAGLWIIAPQKGDFDRLQQIHWNANQRRWEGGKLFNDRSSLANLSVSVDYRLWDMTKGEGWDFYCGDSDQGLLLYWSRFIQSDVSIITGPAVEHYYLSPMQSGGKQAVSSQPKAVVPTTFLSRHSCLPPLTDSVTARIKTFASNSGAVAAGLPFYQDFFHMVGYSKAWESPLKRPLPKDKIDVESSREYWYYILQKVRSRFDSQGVIPQVNDIHREVGKTAVRGDLISVATPKSKTP